MWNNLEKIIPTKPLKPHLDLFWLDKNWIEPEKISKKKNIAILIDILVVWFECDWIIFFNVCFQVRYKLYCILCSERTWTLFFCLWDYHYLDIFHFLIRGVQVNPFYSYPKRLSFKKSLNESTRIVYKEIGNNVWIILYRGGPIMPAISVTIGTKYACNLGYVED